MSRRKPMPGMLSLLDLPAGSPTIAKNLGDGLRNPYVDAISVSVKSPGGQVASLQDLAAKVSAIEEPPAPAVAPKAVVPEKPKPEAPRIVQPSYMRDGLLELPPGLARPPRMANWYCVAHVDGTYRDALAILYRTYSRERISEIEDVSTVMEIPVLGRCWEQREHWIWDVYAPAMAALEAYAAETLGLPVADIRRRHYLTLAHSEETRAIQRDCGRLGSLWSDKGAAA